ncbi:MAG: hypothetical protein ABFR31_07410, partial [Thermodesulfobacteriota bacterium]
MELLIIKSGKDYIRFKDNSYLTVQLDKASVFPFDQMEIVQQHQASLKKEGFQNISIKKLTLTEEDL